MTLKFTANDFYLLAIFAIVARIASAVVVVDFILAFGSINARIRLAFVDVQLTNGAGESSAGTVALEAAKLIDAHTRIEARVRLAIVDVSFALPTSHSRYANAGKVSDLVNTS